LSSELWISIYFWKTASFFIQSMKYVYKIGFHQLQIIWKCGSIPSRKALFSPNTNCCRCFLSVPWDVHGEYRRCALCAARKVASAHHRFLSRAHWTIAESARHHRFLCRACKAGPLFT
jgi:hypothetical protein